jgi:mRNA-degrading endonuclease toxin of MazEF toxin-antitoxin module
MALRFGQIVWTEIADANGVRKARPAIILTPDERIPKAEHVQVAAITSTVPQPTPDDHVLLPWHSAGHPRTGLNRKCAAVCSWLAQIRPADVQNVVEIVPGRELLEIISKVASLHQGHGEADQ